MWPDAARLRHLRATMFPRVSDVVSAAWILTRKSRRVAAATMDKLDAEEITITEAATAVRDAASQPATNGAAVEFDVPNQLTCLST